MRIEGIRQSPLFLSAVLFLRQRMKKVSANLFFGLSESQKQHSIFFSQTEECNPSQVIFYLEAFSFYRYALET
jgi:hypothetical protein